MLHSMASNMESDVFSGYDMSSADATDQAVVAKIKKETKKIIFSRSAQKRRITTYIKKIDDLIMNDCLDEVHELLSAIQTALSEVLKCDDQIYDVYCDNNANDVMPDFVSDTMDKNSECEAEIRKVVS